MLTPNERISKIETRLVEIDAALRIAGALPVIVLQTTLDQMVDEGHLPAATRTAIWGRIRQDIKTIGIGSEEIASGAQGAVPHYTTVEERAASHEREKRFQRETLRLREESRGGDQ